MKLFCVLSLLPQYFFRKWIISRAEPNLLFLECISNIAEASAFTKRCTDKVRSVSGGLRWVLWTYDSDFLLSFSNPLKRSPKVSESRIIAKRHETSWSELEKNTPEEKLQKITFYKKSMFFIKMLRLLDFIYFRKQEKICSRIYLLNTKELSKHDSEHFQYIFSNSRWYFQKPTWNLLINDLVFLFCWE